MSFGEAFLPLEIDMRDIAAVESLAQLDAPWGEIDLLLNNAGLAPPTNPLPDTDWDRIEEVIETNIAGLVALDSRGPAQADRAQGRDHQPGVGRRNLSRTRAARFTPAPRRSFTNSRSTCAATCTAPACA